MVCPCRNYESSWSSGRSPPASCASAFFLSRRVISTWSAWLPAPPMYQVKTLIAAGTGVRQHRESETGSLLPPSLLLMKREVTHILVRDRFGGMLLNRLPPGEEDTQKDKHQSADGIPS